MTLVCWNCGVSIESIPKPISRHAQCPGCFEALRCCRLCRFYNETVAGRCEDERADPPVQKENANFCDFFKPRHNAYVEKRGQQANAARARLNALFGTPDEDSADIMDPESPVNTPSKEDAARAALEALFNSSPKT